MNPEYNDPYWLQSEDTRSIFAVINYTLWDCSSAFMAANGLPNDDQVRGWIDVLERRLDVTDENIQLALRDCREYIKPYTPPISSGSGTRSVPVGTVFKVRKVSSKET